MTAPGNGESVQVTMTWRVPVESTGLGWITEVAEKARTLNAADALSIHLAYSGGPQEVPDGR